MTQNDSSFAKVLGNVGMFVFLYIILMIPTYVLPYFGSNSTILNTAGQATGTGMLPVFWFHLGALIALMVITFFRGSLVNKMWLIIFPILAAIFDMAPTLSVIPLVPTVMHLCAIIIGVSSQRASIPQIA